MKRFASLAATVVFILVSAAYAFAQTKGGGWQLYYSNESGNKYYYDKGSMESPQKGIYKVWQKITETIREGDEQDNFKIHLQINCRAKIYEVLSYIEYDATGEKALNAQEYKENPPKNSLQLGSRMGALYENICP
jgi:hypothetical protein